MHRDQRSIESNALVLEVFQILNRSETPLEAINKILRYLQESLGVSAVGIRLKENGDYPYFSFNGFSDIHVEMEDTLCRYDLNGNVKLDKNGESMLECMCGVVIKGETSHNKPYFTMGGSFWTNNTDTLLATHNPEELGHTRNVCNTQGYLSVALIPLRNKEGIIGLLQLNDEKPDMFTLEIIEFLEGIGESIGIAISHLKDWTKRVELEKERETLLFQYGQRIKELDTLYQISKLKENRDLTTEEVLEYTVNLLPFSTQYADIAVARLTVDDQTYQSENYRDTEWRYSALIQSYGVINGKLTIAYLEDRPKAFSGPFLEEEIKVVNLVAETVSRLIEQKKTGDWTKSLDRYALILNDEEMRHLTKLVIEDMAIGEMDREEFNISDIPDGSQQTIESYLALQTNLELNRNLIIKLQNFLSSD